MERNPYAISVESNPYQIELAGSEHGQVLDDSSDGKHTSNEYAPSNHTSRNRLPTRASISRQGKALVKGVQSRGGCRLAICLLGVTLCWLSSLQVASSFVEILFTPVNGGPQVQQSWSQFSDQINLERLRNLACVNSSLGSCQENLNGQFDAMGFDVDVVALQNSYLVGNGTAYQQRCADLQAFKLKAIQVFKLALTNNSKQILWTGLCTADVVANLNSLYTDPSKTANQATTATSQYGNSNDITWQQAFDSMQARAAYDAEYWANKTQQLEDWYISQGANIHPPNLPNFTGDFNGFNTDLSDYWACATLSNTPPCPYAGGLRASADATVNAFQTKYQSLAASIAQQKNDSQAYLAAAKAKIAGYDDYATTVGHKLLDIKASVEQLRASCSPACDADINSLEASFPSTPDVNVPDVSIDGIYIPNTPVPNWTDIMAGLDFGNQTALIKQKLATMAANVNGAVQGWNDTINANIYNQFNWNSGFSANLGYNPPPVNVDVSNVTNLTASYVAATNGQLSDVAARLTAGGGSGAGNKTESLRNLQLGANSLSSTDYTYASLGGSFDLDLWFFSVNWFRFFMYFLDYAWRIWYSGRIFIRYWFGAAGTMPPIDIRSYRTTKATPLNVRIARYATHPFVLFGGAMVVAILVVSVIIGLYIPLLNDYIQSCVKSDALGGSSFIGDNVYAAAFNAAVLQGNRELSQGLNQYDTARANMCGTKQQNANDAFANQQYQLKIVRDNLQSVTTLLDNMEKCTSMATWDQLLGPPTFHDFNYYTDVPNPPLPSWHIANCTLAGFDALGYLEPPPINCTQLPSCGTQCGVDNSVVEGVSHKASCETEWYVHSTILQSVCTLVVFIFWNICRTLLLDGLVRIYWKHLVRGSGLNFYSTCNKNGQIDTDTEDQLAVAIKESDQSYRRMGVIYIVMSFLLNIPYIVFCILLNIDIAYPY